MALTLLLLSLARRVLAGAGGEPLHGQGRGAESPRGREGKGRVGGEGGAGTPAVAAAAVKMLLVAIYIYMTSVGDGHCGYTDDGVEQLLSLITYFRGHR